MSFTVGIKTWGSQDGYCQPLTEGLVGRKSAYYTKDVNVGDGFVRKGFEIIVTRVADVKYNNVSVTEVAVPDNFEAPASGEVDSGAVAAVYDAWAAEQRAKIAAAEVATPAAKPKR